MIWYYVIGLVSGFVGYGCLLRFDEKARKESKDYIDNAKQWTYGGCLIVSIFFWPLTLPLFSVLIGMLCVVLLGLYVGHVFSNFCREEPITWNIIEFSKRYECK